ncbi:MAG: hypothetical protein ACK4SF_14695 [Algoriphagus aquaeductus]|uniref:hypothetical protein n=1 Tax=Algoriphagus aquaeductus TaxID=475299 RepID=UPI00391A2F60
MNFRSIFLLFPVLVIFLFGCQTEEDPLPKGDFISFRSAGKAYLFQEIENTSWNKYFRGERQDQIGIAFQNQDQSFLAGINIIDSFIWREALPMEVSGPITHPMTPIGDFQLRDLKNQVPVTYGPEDDVNFVGTTTADQIQFTLEKYEGEILEGRFSGTLYTRTGRSMKIESGKFRVRVPVVVNE